MNWENLTSPARTTFKNTKNLFLNWERLGGKAKGQHSKNRNFESIDELGAVMSSLKLYC